MIYFYIVRNSEQENEDKGNKLLVKELKNSC